MLTYKKVTDSETRTITFLDSMNLSAFSFYCKIAKIAKKSGIMREVLIYFLLNNAASYLKESSVDKLYDVSVKSINCVCARTNKQFILIDTPNTENEIKWCEHAILWEFEVFEDCGNCIAMEQSGYISEWQNLLLTLTS